MKVNNEKNTSSRQKTRWIWKEESKCFIPVKIPHTPVVSTGKNINKLNLQMEVLSWLHQIINNLKSNNENHEEKKKIKLEKCLNTLPLWIHESKYERRSNNQLKMNRIRRLQLQNQEKNNQIQSINSSEKILVDWFLKCDKISNQLIVNLFKRRIIPILERFQHTTGNKLIIKREIMDLLETLPTVYHNYIIVYLNKLAAKLKNRLHHEKVKRKANILKQCYNIIFGDQIPSIDYYKVNEQIQKCLKDRLAQRQNTETKHHTEFEPFKIVDSRNAGDVKYGNNSIVQTIVDEEENYEDPELNQTNVTLDDFRRETQGSIFTPIQFWINFNYINYPVTSILQKPRPKCKVNQTEKDYMEKLKSLIRSWIETLPKKVEKNEIKETTIADLVGGIVDQLKTTKIMPSKRHEGEENPIATLVYTWLHKIAGFEDNQSAEPLVKDLLQKIELIPLPNVTDSQSGTRQAIKRMKFQDERNDNLTYVLQSIDLLDKQISIWMNEQPSQIFTNQAKNERNKMTHKLALQLQNRLRNKCCDQIIENNIKQWLIEVVRPKGRQHICLLTQDLKEKLSNIANDKTSEQRPQKRRKYKSDYFEPKRKSTNKNISLEIRNVCNIEQCSKTCLNKIIDKYKEHHDLNDPLITGAITQVLKSELRPLSVISRQKIYEELDAQTTSDKFPSEKTKREIEIIKVIAIWLQNSRIDSSYLTTDSEERTQFITDVARNIQEIDEERKNNPGAMDYDVYLKSIITHSMQTYNIQVLLEYRGQEYFMVDELMIMLIPLLYPDKNVDDFPLAIQNNSKITIRKANEDPREAMVEAIENWSNSLPVKLKDKSKNKEMKDDITRNIYKKIGDLNVNPRICNDDALYKDMLAEEVDRQLDKVPTNSEIEKNRKTLQDDLVNIVLDYKKIIKEKSTGSKYKNSLENTIEASIPDPVEPKNVFDPGFEIYKNHLADMFLLQNFDHSDDIVKEKYENRIRHEIDKYYDSAKNKNKILMTKNEMYNELYSKLFKVSIPDEQMVIDEVEEAKTKCEIELWFQELPLKEPEGLHELLEWDRMLSALAKRIHEIEKTESEADEKIRNEITKRLSKLPLKAGYEKYIPDFADNLIRQLKSSYKDRKYVPREAKDKDKGKAIVGKEPKSKKTDYINIDGNKSNLVSKPILKNCCKPTTPFITEGEQGQFRQQLNDTVFKVLKEPAGNAENKVTLNELNEEIVDYYLLLHSQANDENARREYRGKIKDAVAKFSADNKIPAEDYDYSLITFNKLMCELDKVPKPINDTALKKEAAIIGNRNEPVNGRRPLNLQGTVDDTLFDHDKWMSFSSFESTKTRNPIVPNFESFQGGAILSSTVNPHQPIGAGISKTTQVPITQRPASLPKCCQHAQGTQSLPESEPDVNRPKLTQSTQRPKRDSAFEPDRWMTGNTDGSVLNFSPAVPNYEAFESGAVLTSSVGPRQRVFPPQSQAAQTLSTQPSLSNPRYSGSGRAQTTQTPQGSEAIARPPEDVTPDSLFQEAPKFEPKPLYNPINNPSLESIDEDILKMRNQGSQVNRSIVQDLESDVDGPTKCFCKKWKNRKRRPRPGCMMMVGGLCDQCGRPRLYPMPMPGFMFF